MAMGQTRIQVTKKMSVYLIGKESSYVPMQRSHMKNVRTAKLLQLARINLINGTDIMLIY